MINFDIRKSPPTHQDLAAEHATLTKLKKRRVKQALSSDVLHGSILLLLYFFNFLSGRGLLLTVATAAVFTMALLGKSQQSARSSAPLLAVGAALCSAGILWVLAKEWNTGLLSTALVVASSVFISSRLGPPLVDILRRLEGVKSIAEDEAAQQELLGLCRSFPVLEDYRQQAKDILRPYLTYGELQAMRDWSALHTAQGGD